METDFDWPWQYSFPPFFTVQPIEATKNKQIEDWCSLILAYCRCHRIFVLDLGEAQNNSPLFQNKTINRRLPSAGVTLMVEALVKRGRAEWTDSKKRRAFIFWRRPEEWATSIYRWISATGKTKTVCTFYEIRSGPDTENEEFHELHEELLNRALRVLESQKKAEIIDGEGVKFF